MTNFETMASGVQFTSNFKKNYTPGCTQTEINDYSYQCMLAVCTKDQSEWKCAFTRQNGLRDGMLSLTKDDIKNELLKHAVNVTAYNRAVNNSEASYLLSTIDTGTMTDDRVMSAISNMVGNGEIEEAYNTLDNTDILQSCMRSFVETMNDPVKKNTVPFMTQTDSIAYNLVDSLDLYYARWKSENSNSYDVSGYGRK